MEKEEAKIVLKIMTSADGGCSHCASRLMNKFIDKIGYKAEAEAIYKKAFNDKLNIEEYY